MGATQAPELYRELHEREERYRIISEAIAAMAYVYRVTADGQLIRTWATEKAVEKITGFGYKEIDAQGGWASLVYPDDQPKIQQHFDMLKANQASTVEYRAITKTGQLCWIIDFARPIWDEKEQRVLYIYGASQDITERKQAEQTLNLYAERLRILHEIDQHILTAEEPAAIAWIALRYIRRLIPCQRAEVTLFDFAASELVILASVADTESEAITGKREPLEPYQDIISQLRQGKTFTTIEDIQSLPQSIHVLLTDKINSGISLPLLVQEELIGSINLWLIQPGVITDEHVGIAREVADQLAIAIRQARLLEETQQRLKELAGLHEIAQAFGALTDVRETFGTLAERLAHLVGASMCMVLLLDSDTGEMQAQAPGYGVTDAILKIFHYSARSARDIWNFRERGPFLANSPEEFPHFFYGILKAASLQSILIAPMWVEGRITGQVTVCNKPGGFKPEDAHLLQVFANQAGVVVHNVQLYAESKQHADRLKLLHEIDYAILAAQSAETIAQAALKHIRQLAPCERASLILFDFEADQAVMFAANIKDDLQRGVGERVPLSALSSIKTLEQGRPFIVEDTAALAQRTLLQERRLVEEGIRSYVNLPMMVGSSLIGSLNLAKTMPGSWSPQAIEITREVANQLAIAIQQARLREQVQQYAEGLEHRVADRTRELTALYEVTAVASEALSLATTLEQLLERVLEAMRSQAGAIHLLNGTGQELHLVIQQGLPPDSEARVRALPLESRWPGQVIEQGGPLIIFDITSDPRVHWCSKTSLQACVGVPMRARGHILGVLSVLREKGQPQFNLEEIALLTSIADQAGMVVESARLHQQAGQSAVMEERARLARDLHDSVTQLLYSVNLFAKVGQEAYKAGDLDQVNNCLAELGEIAQQALKEMRLLVYELRPPALEHDGLVGALQHRLDAVEKRAGIQAQLVVDNIPELSGPLEEALYHMAQEALNNALKHAGASTVLVKISSEDHQIELEIIDDGAGFEAKDAAGSGGLGLVSMQERIEKLGGHLSILSTPGEGTRVKVKIRNQEVSQ